MSIPPFDPADRAEQDREARPSNEDLETGAGWPDDVPGGMPDDAEPADVAEQRVEADDADDDDEGPRA